ncbi:hypothetical protein FRC16_004134 [Serendipita sp. 398]|nr:hypothetical protein FRC16_004134 [Serendipita sp. 398]
MSELHLQGAALVIASADDAELGALTHSKYQIRKGVQVCAVLSDLPTVNKIVGENKGQSLGLILRAGWSPSAGFSLDIFFPSPTTFHIGQGIITDPISLKIVLGGTPQLKIIGGAFIPVEGRKEPLHFHLDLTLETLTASATGQLSAPGGWRNPFGISEQLVIGPDLALKVSIVYSTFFIQGPSGFGFVGGLKIGKVVGKMEFNIEEVPSRQLLSAKVENLDLHDLVEFANNVSPVPIARPPNVVSFHEVSLYMCPAGVTIGTIIYPAGFSFISKVTLFGINADVNVSVGSSGVKCKGGIDNFKLGPLTVRGVKEPRAMFELELTSSKQAGKIDGMIEFLGVEIVMVANFELHPNFTFHFMFLLHLTDLFTFEVYAYPISTPSEENPDVTVTDYRLTAEFRNKTRDQLTLKINKMFDEKARREAKEAETTQQKLDEARQAWQADMDEKQRKLDKAYASWTTKSSETHDRLESIKREQKAKVDDLRHKLEHEREKLHRNVNETQAALTAANNERSARLHKDRENLQAKRAEWDGYISNAHRKVDDTTRDLHNRFGNTERDIEEARRKVNSLEQDIDNFDREIDRLGLTPWWDLPSKAQIPALATAKGALIFSKEVADGVLRMALGVVEAQDFIVRKGAMQLAHFALDEAQRCGATAIRIADEALALTDRLTTELVANANKALEGARWLGNTAVDAADGALVVAEKSSIVIIAAAQALVDGLTSCAEWIAYQAASAAVAVAKEAGSDALLLAKVGAKIGTAISQFAMKAWQWILLHLTSFVDIREIVLSAQLGMACGGAEFDAAIRGTMADDHFFDFHISFSTAHTTEFITAIFDKLVDMIEDGFLEGGKAITAVAQGLSGDLVKSLQQL